MTIDTALRAIAIRCPSISGEAVRTLRATGRVKPQRVAWLVEQALMDPLADWTPEERAQLIDLVTPEPTRTTAIPPVRVTPDERAAIEAAAQDAGLTLSDYIRSRLL
jgi:hypothetical protein